LLTPGNRALARGLGDSDEVPRRIGGGREINEGGLPLHCDFRVHRDWRSSLGSG